MPLRRWSGVVALVLVVSSVTIGLAPARQQQPSGVFVTTPEELRRFIERAVRGELQPLVNRLESLVDTLDDRLALLDSRVHAPDSSLSSRVDELPARLFGSEQSRPDLVASPKKPSSKTCEVKKSEIIHSGNVDRFRNCTILQGSIQILQYSFDGFQEIYKNYTFGTHYAALHPSRLEVFSDVKEITGYVNIDAYHEDFRDLGFLRRLKVIGGHFLHEYFTALYIVKTSLQSLELKSLQKISSGGVLIAENKDLCFVDGINWKTFISSDQESGTTAYDVTIENNRNTTSCAGDGLVCHSRCSADGCWGRGLDSCLN